MYLFGVFSFCYITVVETSVIINETHFPKYDFVLLSVTHNNKIDDLAALEDLWKHLILDISVFV